MASYVGKTFSRHFSLLHMGQAHDFSHLHMGQAPDFSHLHMEQADDMSLHDQTMLENHH